MNVAVALRGEEQGEEEVCLQRWEVNTLNRAMQKGKNISRLGHQKIFFLRRVSWRIKTLASKLAFWDSEGHCYSVFTSKFLPPRNFLFLWLKETPVKVKGSEPDALITLSFWERETSAVVTVTPSARSLLFTGGVSVQVDVGDTVDLSDLTSHQVEQSFAKHDLKCAGPEQTLLSPWPTRAVISQNGPWELTAVAFPKQITAAFGNTLRPRDLALTKMRAGAAAANALANALPEYVCVCVDLPLCVCVYIRVC